MKKYFTVNICVPLFFFIASTVWFIVSLKTDNSSNSVVLYTTPTTFPNIILVLAMAMTLWTFIEEIIKRKKELTEISQQDKQETQQMDSGILRAVALAVVILLYSFLMKKIGFIISSIIMMLAALLLFKERRKSVLILVPIFVTLFLYFLFKYALNVGLTGIPGVYWI